MSSPVIYTVGGTVQAGGGIYVSRQADAELLNLCRNRTFAYVLTPRQMGKSSLMVQTARTLEQEGVRTVIIDLTEIGTQATAEEWYLGLLTLVEDQLGLDTDPLDWWEEQAHLGFTQRLTRFFKDVVLAEVTEPTVVFVDEIDTTLSLTFSDDFFIAIRYFYTARAQNPDFDRLSFVLIGVATPADLIRDPQRTPFNVGQRVDLTDFTPTEAQPLAAGLASTPAEARQMLTGVLEWTGGHPYLTQRLCQALVEQGRGSRAQGTENPLTTDTIAQTVAATFFGPQSEQDTNLQFVRDMLTQRAPDIYQVLTIYKDIRRGRQGIVDEEQSITKSHLKLAGVVKRDADKTLRVRNAIYATVFNDAWVRQNLPVNWRKRIARLRGALAAGAVMLTVGMAGLTTWALLEQARAKTAGQQAEIERERAEIERERAEEAWAEASFQRDKATEAAYKAQVEAAGAKNSAREAQKQRELAEQRQQEASAAKQLAEQQRQQAQQAQQAEAQQRQTAEARRQEAEQARAAEALARNDAEAATEQAIAANERVETQRRIAQAQELAAQADAARRFRVNLLPTSILLAAESSRRLLEIETASPETKFSFGQANAALREYTQMAEEIARLNHDSSVRAVSFSPDGRYVATASDDGTARVWEATTGREITRLTHNSSVTAVSFSPDGRYVATASADNTARVWETATNREIARLTHDFSVLVLSFSPDGRYVATTSADNTARVWETATNREIARLTHDFSVRAVSFSSNGRYVATASDDGTARVWEATTGREITRLTHDFSVSAVSFSPDGRYIATASDDNTARVWETVGGREIARLTHNSPVHALSFSPDGQYVATASLDNTARVWETVGGREIARLTHDSSVWAVSFSPDGQYVATASRDSTARVWETVGGREIARLTHDSSVWAVSFSPNGQ